MQITAPKPWGSEQIYPALGDMIPDQHQIDHLFCSCQWDERPAIAYCGFKSRNRGPWHINCDHEVCGLCTEMAQYECPICQDRESDSDE